MKTLLALCCALFVVACGVVGSNEDARGRRGRDGRCRRLGENRGGRAVAGSGSARALARRQCAGVAGSGGEAGSSSSRGTAGTLGGRQRQRAAPWRRKRRAAGVTAEVVRCGVKPAAAGSAGSGAAGAGGNGGAGGAAGAACPASDPLKTKNTKVDAYDRAVLAESAKWGMPDPMIAQYRQIQQESSFAVFAISGDSSCGIKQGLDRRPSPSRFGS